MKNFTYTLLFLVSFNLFAQNKLSSSTKQDLELITKVFHEKSFEKHLDLERKFPVFDINGEKFISVLAKISTNFNKNELIKKGIIVGTIRKNIATLKVPFSKLVDLENIEGITYFEIAAKIVSNMDQAIKDVRADSVHKGISLPQAYTGKNVYVGITDWGFDYTHPNFYDTLLNETRIEAAWDQYKKSGPAPSGFTYGTEYKTKEALLEAKSDTANIYSYAYHGSHVAGIAGGSGAGTPHRGIAFESKFLLATFLIDAAAVIDAYEWMYLKALSDQKRLVINQSWGLHHIGTLDGNSLLSQAIDNYSELGVIFVSSGGNNGDRSFHIKKTFQNDTILTRVNFYTYDFETMWGQSISLWGEPNKAFSVKMQVLNTSNQLISETPFYTTTDNSNYLDSTLIIGLDTVFFNLSTNLTHPLNDRSHMRLRIKNKKTAFKIVLKITANEGTVHAWNVVELINEVGNWGLPFSKIYSYYVAGDNEYGISEPACSKGTIAVAAYATNANIASFSSKGPTLDERIKPDVAAPGVNITSSISSYTDGNYTSLTTVDFNGRTYPFARLSGTSMAGPVVSGIVALLLEANPYLSVVQIKEILKESARMDNFTGSIPIEGSLVWGAGKVNAYRAIQIALETIGNVEINEIVKQLVQFFPNPTSDVINVKISDEIPEIQIINSLGEISICKGTQNQFSLNHLSKGSYLIRFNNKGKIIQHKIIKI